MHAIDDKMFAAAGVYSDWRLYQGSVDSSCALQAIGERTLSELHNSTGRWVSYQELSDDAKGFVALLHSKCLESNLPFHCVRLTFTTQTKKIVLRIQEMGGFYACKRVLAKPPSLGDLSLPDPVLNMLRSKQLQDKGGLVIMIGDTGTGKTTTATATMRDRLKIFGGYGLVLGDPPECPVNDDSDIGNKVGLNGYVNELDVSAIGYTKGLQHGLRSFPIGEAGRLLYGEVRSDSNALDLVLASCNGHELFSTMHAMTANAALDRLILLCVRDGASEHLVRSILAQALFGFVLHRVTRGVFSASAHPATEDVKTKIRNGVPLPFTAQFESFQTLATLRNNKKP